MPKFKHSFWRYIPSTDERQSFFKFVESFETDNENVPKFEDHYCIDHIVNLETGQMRVKNHSAPEYCVSKYVGSSLKLPPVEKTNKQEIYVVIHRSSFNHKKIEFDEFLEPKDKRYSHEEWDLLLANIEKRFNKQKEWAIDGIKIPTKYDDGGAVFRILGQSHERHCGCRGQYCAPPRFWPFAPQLSASRLGHLRFKIVA